MTEIQVQALLLKCRRGCWLELELPRKELPERVMFGAEIRIAPRYPVDNAGLAMARKEWKAAGSPSSFYGCLRIGGYNENSYILPH